MSNVMSKLNKPDHFDLKLIVLFKHFKKEVCAKQCSDFALYTSMYLLIPIEPHNKSDPGLRVFGLEAWCWPEARQEGVAPVNPCSAE